MKQRSYLMGLWAIALFAGCGATEPMTGSSDAVSSRGMPQAQRPVTSGGQASPGQTSAQIPTFPQKFDVQGPEADSFGFAVTQPGPVVVDVQGQGAPVIVTLQPPGGQPIVQQATGNLKIPYSATQQDIQRGLFWGVHLRLAQPRPPQAGGRANGTINVQYPPANQAVVQQAVGALAAQQKPPSTQEQQQAVAQAATQLEQAFQQRKAQFEQQQMQRRAAMQAQIQPQIDQLRSRMSGAVKPRGVEGAESPAEASGVSPEGEIGTRALRGEALTGITLQPMNMPNPTITSLSVPQGQPGDAVMINGTAFGTSGGEVHFIIAPNMDVIYQGQTWWYDNQILVNVPDATKLLAYNGYLYVVRGSDKAKTSLVPFHFEPAIEFRTIILTQDHQIGSPGYTWRTGGGYEQIEHQNANPFWGYKGNDIFFTNTRLKNNWVFDDAYLTPILFKRGGAYFQEKNVGTNWPSFNIRFWVDGCFGDVGCAGTYAYLVSIRGPKGVSDGVVVP